MVLSVEELLVLAGGSIEDRMIAARSRRTPPKVLVSFTMEENPRRRAAFSVAYTALQNPKFPLEARWDLIFSEKNMFRSEALTAKHLSVEFLRKVHLHLEELEVASLQLQMSSTFYLVTSSILRHPNCPEELLYRFAGPFVHINLRRQIAARRHLPDGLFCSLAKDESLDIRKDVARKRGLPKEAAAVLRNDKDSVVRKALVCNRWIPAEWLSPMIPRERSIRVLTQLAKRHPEEFRAPVIAKFEGMLRPGATGALLLVEWSNNLEVLNRLCFSPDIWVRRIAAQSPRVSDESKAAAYLLGV